MFRLRPFWNAPAAPHPESGLRNIENLLLWSTFIIIFYSYLLTYVLRSDYVDPSLHGFQSGVQEQELLSRKSSASSTASLDRHEIRY